MDGTLKHFVYFFIWFCPVLFVVVWFDLPFFVFGIAALIIGVSFPLILAPLPRDWVDVIYYTLVLVGLMMFYMYEKEPKSLLAQQTALSLSNKRLSFLKSLKENTPVALDDRKVRDRLQKVIAETNKPFIRLFTGHGRYATLPRWTVENYYKYKNGTAFKNNAMHEVKSRATVLYNMELKWNSKKMHDVEAMQHDVASNRRRHHIIALWPYILTVALCLKLARIRLISLMRGHPQACSCKARQ